MAVDNAETAMQIAEMNLLKTKNCKLKTDFFMFFPLSWR